MTHQQEDFTLGDPLSIANQGLLSNSGFTIAVQGFLVQIVEEIVEIPIVGGGGAPGADRIRRKEQAKKYRKKITVTVTIDGKDYKETVYTDNLTMNLKDVKVEIAKTQEAPKLIVHLPEYISEDSDDE